jgi:hypothetical protein
VNAIDKCNAKFCALVNCTTFYTTSSSGENEAQNEPAGICAREVGRPGPYGNNERNAAEAPHNEIKGGEKKWQKRVRASGSALWQARRSRRAILRK